VLVNDISSAGEKIAREIGGRFVQGDVTRSDDWTRLVGEAGAQLDAGARIPPGERAA